ncbi:MAG TPA: hypothetical protein VK993_16915 [Chthoniobacterales bacterium]|nr:hypothetical protein [Chthoniobacterales bacterium]
MIADRLAKLRAQSESLQTLLLRAYAKFLFFRPMMVNMKLNDRISAEGRHVGFEQLRNWLYWDFIQELVKICADPDRRAPSIRNINEALANADVLQELRRSYACRTWPIIRPEDREAVRQLEEEDRRTLEVEFDDTFRRFWMNADALLNSEELAGYSTIRNKLIAHNELRHTAGRYGFFDVRLLKLKYGHERKLLENAREIIDAIELLVRNCSFSWDSFVDQETQDVCTFWEIDGLEE